MASVEDGIAAQVRNIEARYGRPLAEWFGLIARRTPPPAEVPARAKAPARAEAFTAFSRSNGGSGGRSVDSSGVL